MSDVIRWNSIEEIPDSYMQNVWNQRWPDINPRDLASKGDGEIAIRPESMDRLQNLQDRLDNKLIINSGYRSRSYNNQLRAAARRRGGGGPALNSQHIESRAFDISMSNQDPLEFEAAALDAGFTGFGYYGPADGNFIHIDDRPSNRIVTWYGKSKDWPYKTINRHGARRPTPGVDPEPRSSKADPLVGGQPKPDRSVTPNKIPHVGSGRVLKSKSGTVDPGISKVAFDPKDFGVNSDLSDNPFNDYINVTSNLRLSMVIQPTLLGADSTSYQDLEGLDIVTFASSAEQASQSANTIEIISDDTSGNVTTVDSGASKKTQRTSKVNKVNELYTIQTANLRHIGNLTANNPELGFTTEAKISIHEPYGLTLEKRIREVAYELGYRTSPIRVIWRFDIHWSGYNQKTGNWVRKIPFNNQFAGKSNDTITHFFHMTSIEASFEPSGGTIWQLDAVPIGFAAVWKETISFDAALITPYTSQGKTARLSGYLDALAGALTFQVVGDASEMPSGGSDHRRGVTRIFYEINYEGLGELADSAITQSFSDVLRAKNLITDDPSGGAYVNIGQDVTVLQVIRAILDSAEELNREFVQSDDPNKVGPRTSYVIRPMVKYDTAEVNSLTNDYKSITVVYYIEKFIDWRIIPNKDGLLNQTLRQQRIEGMRASPALRRVYNYAFTPSNTEVKNFDIKLKVLYYEPFADPSQVVDSVGNINNPEKRSETGSALAQDTFPNNKIAHKSSGSPDSHISSANHHGRVSLGSTAKHVGPSDSISENNKTHEQYLLEFEKRLFGDLVELNNMQVRGDPRWLLSKSSANVPLGGSQYSSIIRVNIFSPEQSEYMEEVWNPKKPPIDESLGGFYEVVEIETTFDGGDFSHSLSGYRIRSM